MNKYGRTTFILPFTDGHIPYILSQSHCKDRISIGTSHLIPHQIRSSHNDYIP